MIAPLATSISTKRIATALLLSVAASCNASGADSQSGPPIHPGTADGDQNSLGGNQYPGSSHHGCLHSADHWLWGAVNLSRRPSTLSHVQPSHLRPRPS